MSVVEGIVRENGDYRYLTVTTRSFLEKKQHQNVVHLFSSINHVSYPETSTFNCQETHVIMPYHNLLNTNQRRTINNVQKPDSFLGFVYRLHNMFVRSCLVNFQFPRKSFWTKRTKLEMRR